MQKSYHIGVADVDECVKKLVLELKGNEIFALNGPLGSGKTTFVKALAKNLGLKRRVTSPTFILLQKFTFQAKKFKQPLTLLHLDAYRIKNSKEIKLLGLEELWGRKNVITVIEWADKIKAMLPKKTIYIYFHAKRAKA